MKSGNDGILYTGGNSRSFNRNDRRTEQAVDKSQKRTKLLPAAEVVIEAIDKEIAKLGKINFEEAKELINNSTPHALEIDTLAKEKAITSMKSLRQTLENVLRESKEDKR